jgi:23S rRNA (cytosine1962-C5)-methyltransferase
MNAYKGLVAKYVRSESGGGRWIFKGSMPEEWTVNYKDLTFKIKPMGFKHTGLFPEQAVNWDLMRNLIEQAGREITVLNLFAYTGGATVACAKSGAKVTHVDSAKGMVERAGENVRLSGVQKDRVRYIIDDCKKFVEREIRRGKKYDAVIMDPPSYGRGPNGEMWKLESELYPLVELCEKVLSDDPLFFLINSYTTGLQPQVIKNILSKTIAKGRNGRVEAYEVGLNTQEDGVILPCGNSGIWIKE